MSLHLRVDYVGEGGEHTSLLPMVQLMCVAGGDIPQSRGCIICVRDADTVISIQGCIMCVREADMHSSIQRVLCM